MLISSHYLRSVVIKQIFIRLIQLIVIRLILTSCNGLIMQLLGKDLLRLKFVPEQRSYWIERTPPGPEPETIEEVF